MNLETIDNIYFYNEKFSEFLKKKPDIPQCQRSYTDERVNYFYNQLINNQINGIFPYIGILHCSLYTQNGVTKNYIVDGQHRFYAYKKYYETFKKDFSINYIVKTCLSKNDVTTFFKSLNDNYNPHELILDNLDKAELVKNYIKTKYDKHISHSETPRYPNVNIDQITKYIIDTFENSDDIVQDLENLNEDICSLIKNDPKFEKNKQGLYLGYIFIKTEIENKRKKIPVTVRHTLWGKYFGEYIFGNCYVCSKKIDNSNFHAGHITSAKNGGTDNISNLLPICSCCNLSMTTQNIKEFKSKYF